LHSFFAIEDQGLLSTLKELSRFIFPGGPCQTHPL
jgi:hypothetical protein